MGRLTGSEVVRWRAASSLILRRESDAPSAVGRLFGLQAQDILAMHLAVRARAGGCSQRDVVAAIDAPPILVRTWAMRGTLHLGTAADARWLTQLLGPRLQLSTTRRRRELGIPDDRCAEALPLLEEVLAGGPLDRAAIVRGLGERDFDLTPGGQAVPHLLGYAAAGGLVCCGPGDTFALVESWLPPAPKPPNDALAELGRRYLAGHGPAGAEDFAAWSGLPLTQARKAFAANETDLTWWDTDHGRMATLTASAPESAGSAVARLLPRYDDYLLGWRDRDLVLDPAYRRAIHPGGGRPQCRPDHRRGGAREVALSGPPRQASPCGAAVCPPVEDRARCGRGRRHRYRAVPR
jgi:hypothetical protein